MDLNAQRPGGPPRPFMLQQGQARRARKSQAVFAMHTTATALAPPGVRNNANQSMAGRRDSLIDALAHALPPALH
eukprot:11181136-Lingulodinium_polyedra.AAC.1